MATEERTIEVEQGSSSDNTEDEETSSESDEDEVGTSSRRRATAKTVQLSCLAVMAPNPFYQHDRTRRKGSGVRRARKGKENRGHRRHDREHSHGREDGHRHEHSDSQGQEDTESHHRQSEGHRHGGKSHHHGSRGHHHRGGHRRHRGGRRGHRRRSSSDEDESDLFWRVDVKDFKQEQVNVAVSVNTVKIKASSDSGEMLRVFKITEDYDTSKIRVWRSISGVLRVLIPAKDSKVE